MKYWISLSGGKGSAMSAIVAHMNGLNFELIFADTTIEDPDLYRFNEDVAKAVGKEIIKLTDGRDPWSVFVDKRFIGNSRTAHCSSELKTKVVREYLNEHAQPDDILVLGMDYSEIDRIERAKKNWAPRQVRSLLNDFKCWRSEWDAIFKLYGIKTPALYDYGFPHNNCGGFCVRAGLKQFATLLERFPERFDYHKQKEVETVSKIGPTARPFLRWTKNKQEFYITMGMFELLYKMGDIKVDPYDWGGCECFINEESDNT